MTTITITNTLMSKTVSSGPPPPPPFDPDAQAFFTASGLTGATELNAVNQLVVDLKGFGIWTKMKAIYPIIGGTAALHKWNLKDPQDTNAAFRLVFNGGWTHSATGAQGNGVNAWANTFLNISTNYLTPFDIHLSTNINSDHTRAGQQGHIGVQTGASSNYRIGAGSAISEISILGTSANVVSFAVTSTTHKGFWCGSRTANNVHDFIDPNGIINSNTSTITATLPNQTIGLAARRGATTQDRYSNFGYSFFTAGLGLSTVEMADLKTAVDNYQITLGRI